MRRFWSDLLASLYNIRDGIIKKKQELDEERAACEAEKEELRGQVAELEEELANAEGGEANCFPHMSIVFDGFILYHCDDYNNNTNSYDTKEAVTFMIDKNATATQNLLNLIRFANTFFGRTSDLGDNSRLCIRGFCYDRSKIDDIINQNYRELFIFLEQVQYNLYPVLIFSLPQGKYDLRCSSVTTSVNDGDHYLDDGSGNYIYYGNEDENNNVIWDINDTVYELDYE